VQPTVNGREANAGRLHVRVLEPAGAVIRLHDWRQTDRGEFRQGWRIDVSGGTTGYVIELYEN
ncbi:hypothetical protein, partial [Luteimonas notoginsengisoli]